MIVWSKGLGKQRLPINLDAAAVSIEAGELKLAGVIDPVCWDYAIRLTLADIAAFLDLMARPMTVRYLAQRPGLLGPLVFSLLRQAPQLLAAAMAARLGPSHSGE